jgi:CHAT domain-containing protein/tetratricopeptide (TPR) repeat protein
MKNIHYHLRITFSLVCFLMGSCLIAIGQTPAATASPQSSPVPPQIPTEIKSIVEEFNKELHSAQSLVMEGQKLMAQSSADSLPAREKLNQALILSRDVNAKVRDNNLLDKVRQSGETAEQSLNDLKVFEFYSKNIEALSLNGVAQTHANLGERQEFIDSIKQTIGIYQEIILDKTFPHISGIKVEQQLSSLKFVHAAALVNLGQDLDNHFGKSEEALKYLHQALEAITALYQETPKSEIKSYEALILKSIGTIYGRESKGSDKAIEFFTKSLDIYRTLTDGAEEVAETLSAIANQQAQNLDYENALKNWREALAIYLKVDHKSGQSGVLRQIGLMYWILNNKSKVAEYTNQNLAILRSPDFKENWKKRLNPKKLGIYDELYDAFIEHTRLETIGSTYRLLDDYQQSLEYYEKALVIARTMKQPRTIRLDLASIAHKFAKLEKWDKAAEFYKQALEISRKQGVREDIASDLQDVGWALLEGGKASEALPYQNEALSIYQSVGVDENKAFSINYSNLLNELGRSHEALGNRRLAIFYGKRAINAIQGERQRLQNLDAISQKGFLEQRAKHYRRLADWLIAEGRLPEAEQVLAILKEDEYFRYIRRDPAEVDKLSQRTDLSSDEKVALNKYNEISSRLAEIGVEYSKLEEKKNSLPEGVSLSPLEAKRFAELTKQVEDANNVFQVFLRQLAEEFAKTPKATKVKDETQQNSGLRSDLSDWRREFGDNGVVALYTVLGENRYRVILTTPSVRADGKYEIKAEKLREKIAAFRQALQNPQLDPRPLGKELYDILVKPIEKQLAGANAKILLWSLDDTLRYVPIAALWDGKQYFGQKYQNVVITLASRTRLKERSDANWRVLGLGVSEPKQVNLAEPDGSTRSLSFKALPAVREELQAIVRDETSQQAETGILPGRRLLNSTFTEASLKESLGKRYKVIHIASHFSFRPGDLTKSFLLLGDGQVLTLNKIKNNPQLAFTGVELLTLSACKTAVGETNADGAEVESFGVVAQETGAKAVMATLWSVADESTSLLMSGFYRLRTENSRLTKSEALQLAQKEMMEGKLKPQTVTGEQRDTGEIMNSVPNAPQYPYDPKRPYAHPYYWAPFILIGNWR